VICSPKAQLYLDKELSEHLVSVGVGILSGIRMERAAVARMPRCVDSWRLDGYDGLESPC
jgi:hypothetical protein